MLHHADFAVSVSQALDATTSVDPNDGQGPIAGRVIALGWWVDPGAADDPEHEPTGTLYLVVDDRRPRPYWVAQDDLLSVRMRA